MEKMDTWYSLKPQQIIEAGGRGLLDKYKGSLYQCLKTLFPGFHFPKITSIEEDWKPYKFSDVQGYFHNPENRKKYMEDLSKVLGIQKMEDWYSISANTIKLVRDNFPYSYRIMEVPYSTYFLLLVLFLQIFIQNILGSQVFKLYNSFLNLAKFAIKEPSVWGDIKVQRQFFDELAKKFNVTM